MRGPPASLHTHLGSSELLDVCQPLDAHLQLLVALVQLRHTRGEPSRKQSTPCLSIVNQPPLINWLAWATKAGLTVLPCSATAAASKVSTL